MTATASSPELATPEPPAAGPARAAGELLLIFLAGLVIYGWKVGVPPIAGTEPLRALVGHQMAHAPADDWLLPRLYGELYLRKPPLQYWIIAATERAIGFGNEWVWRAPSVIGSALLAVVLAAWSARWFGARARLVTGFSVLGLITLWAQDRGADIDALDTAAAVIAAACVLEIAAGPPGRRGLLWGLALAAATAALLLLKGPAGLPTLLGALIACLTLAPARRVFARPSLWAGLLIGVFVFAGWLLAVRQLAERQHLVIDTSGAQEAEQRMLLLHPTPPSVGFALLAPLRVLLYTMPITLALPLALSIAGRLEFPDPRDLRIRLIARTLLIALAVGVLAGITNPRYSYVCTPLLAPLLGASATIAWESRGIRFAWARHLIIGGLRVVTFAWAGAAAIFTVVALKKAPHIDPREHLVIPAAALWILTGGCVLLGGWAALSNRMRLSSRGWVSMLLTAAISIPFAEMKNAERTRFSGRAVGQELRQDLGDDPRLSACSVVRDLPQVFYYADVPVEAFGEGGIEAMAAAPGERWVVIENDEAHHELDHLRWWRRAAS